MSCGCTKVTKTIGQGMVGLTMSALGPHATPEIRRERAGVCQTCDDRIWDGRRAICRRCKCWLVALRATADPRCEKFPR